MEKAIFLVIGIIVTMFSCKKELALKGTPNCVEWKTKEIANNEVWNPTAKIYSYSYNGATVYYFPPRCCDIPGELYDEDCNLICRPDGGFTGDGDGKCPDFFKLRTGEKLIWEDKRI